ncbi:MAG TPA: polyphenol oxidase family protein [Longimicrobiales bacterium]|nr:polyphenol oxidase family protein [Longimicrobiales bacterium]
MSGEGTRRAAPAGPALPAEVRQVREPEGAGPVPLRVHPDWQVRFPWLMQATTGRGDPGDPFDLGLFGDVPVGRAMARWRRVREALGARGAVHARQVHGVEIRRHDDAAPDGLLVTEGVDGHITGRPGLLLAVSVADCVPVFVVDPERRRVALLHGGWRGTAAGIVGRGLELLGEGAPDRLHVHLGPAICGLCYEVGPEVHEALGLPVPHAKTPVDVRAVQARQAVDAGVPPEHVTVSDHCTRCGSGFFSHRGGDSGRQMGVLGIRP